MDSPGLTQYTARCRPVFWTDSNGVAAIDDVTLEGHDVTFTVKSHGYEFQPRIQNEPAARVMWSRANMPNSKIRRVNIA